MSQATDAHITTVSVPKGWLNLQRLSVPQLVALHAAYSSAADAFLSIENQPRGKDVDLLNDERERCHNAQWQIAEELKARPVNDGVDGFYALQVLIEHTETPEEILETVADYLGRSPRKLS